MNYKLYRQMKLDFSKRYNKQFLPSVGRFEIERMALRKKLFMRTWIRCFIGTILAIFLLMYMSVKEEVMCLILFPILCFVDAFIEYGIKKKEFEISLKKKFLNELCKCFDDIKWQSGYGYWEEERNITSEIADAFAFQIPNDSSCRSYDDIFKGVYNGVGFDILEAEYLVVQEIKKHGIDENFDGLIIRMPINKNFKSHTVVRPHKPLQEINKELKKTVLEDVVFEKKYDVFTNDELEARYLLTTAFMDRLNNIKKIFDVPKAGCAFYQKNLYIALYTKKDLFKLFAINKSINDYSQFAVFFDEILSIYKCIDYFKLSKKKV